ncbi:hypothetical protein [Algoriphagus confluentis]|uniref:Uncharacterized protein n=1 Tax=Algoriphagus confluentis TaxID=1697556 RepID=A0ABQ6PWD3_9BACT|nr:hypothetical protein Aconfl_42500 [Algoriphagus confluentis]
MPELFDQYHYEPKNKSVNAIIREFEKEYQEIFELAKTKWNHSIREFHRDATGLKLSRNSSIGRGMTIQIRFLPDEENQFIKLIDEHFPELDFMEYTKIRSLHDALIHSDPYFQIGEIGLPFQQLVDYCSKYLDRYNLKKLHSLLFTEMGKSKDVLGAYYFKDSRIELYYVPLIIFSQIHRISLEHLIVVVLAHELAHAYHHIGFDTDGYQWDEMSKTDSNIVEGLAQYYTSLFVEDQETIYPGVKDAYLELLAYQTVSTRATASLCSVIFC